MRTHRELEASGMKRRVFHEPEALVAPGGSVQRVFKAAQNRGKESFRNEVVGSS